MRRADRLFQIVQVLRGGRLTTAQDLADRLEVSPRTIYRDIADLIGSGVPIDGEAGMGYMMRDGYDLPPLMFTSNEITALVAGARMIRVWGGKNMGAAIESALEKIDTVLPDEARERAQRVGVHVIGTDSLTPETRQIIDTLESAADNHTRLKIEYLDLSGQTSNRIIRPLGIWFWGDVWTTVTWCELRDDFRMFRVDRITALTSISPFQPEEGKTLKDFYAQGRHTRQSQ